MPSSNLARDFHFIKYLLANLHEKLPHFLTGNLGFFFVFLWLALSESQQSTIRLYPQMLSWPFHWTYLVFILSNLHNITSQYCMTLCNNMAYTSHHRCKPNWPQSFNCSQLLTQTFLAAASSLGKSFSDRTSWGFLPSSQIPFGAEITDISSHHLTPARVFYVHCPAAALPEIPFRLRFRRCLWRKNVPKSDCRFESVSFSGKKM